MPKPVQFDIEWDAPEHEHKVRSADWFWAVGITTVSLALVAIILGNIIFGLLILVSAGALALFINKEPNYLHIRISEQGITKDRIHYPYHSLESFWIDTDHPHKKIILRSKKLLMPHIVIPIGDDVDAERVHRVLSRLLPEEYHALPIVERLLEYLGF
jgi:hypothetical protein